MPIEILKSANELQPYIKELPIPKGLNGKEQNFLNFIKTGPSPKLKTQMEVYRRMQDLHDAMISGRFFLCISQRSEYPELYKEPTPKWAISWVQSRFIESSIQSYDSAFDLYLQINWFYFELYKHSGNTKVPNELTKDLFSKILFYCNINAVMTESNKSVIGKTIYDAINAFRTNKYYIEIHKLCKALKHRQRINFEELSKGKHQLDIIDKDYNSRESLLVRSIPDVISNLKGYHKELSSLCEISLSFWTFESEKFNVEQK